MKNIPSTLRGGKESIDFKEISRSALANVGSVLERWLPGGKQYGREYVALNPRRSDTNPGSFKINLDTGNWADFATKDKGSDLISVVAYVQDVKQSDAAKMLAEFLHLPISGGNRGSKSSKNRKAASSKVRVATPAGNGALHPGGSGVTESGETLITPIPESAGNPPGGSAMQWIYRDKEGRPILHIRRINKAPGGKYFLPFTYWKKSDGTFEWRNHSLPEPRPLYNLDQLAAHPKSPVLIVEGEKAADAAALLFPATVVTTSSHGADSADKSDWSSLCGRQVVIWPDNDEPGKAYAQQVSELVNTAGAAQIKIVDLRKVSEIANLKVPDGFDLADVAQAGWTSEQITHWLEQPGVLKEHSPPQAKMPSGFKLTARGISHTELSEDGEREKEIFVCSPLRITARVRDLSGNAWGRVLEFEDPEGITKRWAMPMRLLNAGGDEYRAVLLDKGLHIAPGSKPRGLLTTYIQVSRPERLARCVETTGWHGRKFVLPNETISSDADELVIFQSEGYSGVGLSCKGDATEWREQVAALCAGNSRLVFAISSAFAAPLLYLLQEEGGGFHFRGSSSQGKTTVLHVACSVFGGREYMGTWRATDNGLEGEAVIRNDLLMALDEISQIDPLKVGEVAYMLANGRGKKRSGRTGAVRASGSWRVLYLSSGELSLSALLNNGARRSTAGQEVRVVDIPSDAGKGLGVFDCLPERVATPKILAETLKANCWHRYGTAGHEFIQQLVQDLARCVEMARVLKDGFLSAHLTAGASSQVGRVASRFALVAAAGELATDLGITGWEVGEATSAAKICFDAWLDSRGTDKALEPEILLSQVRQFFAAHADAKFTPLDATDEKKDPTHPTLNRAGFRKSINGSTIFWVFPEIFKSEICKGFDPKWAAQVLHQNGLIERGSDDKYTINQRLPDIGQKRIYCFSDKVFGD